MYNIRHLNRLPKIFRNQRQARAWVNQGGLKVAAHCMFHLNRYARSSPGYSGAKTAIYLLKSRLIEYLYLNGHCTSVDSQVQTMACWHTYEYNNGYEDYCYKCHGSNIYHQHFLYRFVFDVNGRTYVWHQPENLVKFLSLMRWGDGGESEYTPHLSDYSSILFGNASLASIYLAAVAYFLIDAGMDGDGKVRQAGLMGPVDLLKVGYDVGRRELRLKRKFAIARFRGWLAMRVPVQYRDRIDPDWDIPF